MTIAAFPYQHTRAHRRSRGSEDSMETNGIDRGDTNSSVE